MQILVWADVKEPVCENPYKFTCGNFINQYRNHELYLINKGEWGSNSHFEYEGEHQVRLLRIDSSSTFSVCRLKCSKFIYIKTTEFAIEELDSADDQEDLHELHEHSLGRANTRESAGSQDDFRDST